MLALRALLMFVPSELTIMVASAQRRGNLYTDLRYELIDRHVAPFLAMTG